MPGIRYILLYPLPRPRWDKNIRDKRRIGIQAPNDEPGRPDRVTRVPRVTYLPGTSDSTRQRETTSTMNVISIFDTQKEEGVGGEQTIPNHNDKRSPKETTTDKIKPPPKYEHCHQRRRRGLISNTATFHTSRMTLTPRNPNDRLDTPPEILQYGQTFRSDHHHPDHQRQVHHRHHHDIIITHPSRAAWPPSNHHRPDTKASPSSSRKVMVANIAVTIAMTKTSPSPFPPKKSP